MSRRFTPFSNATSSYLCWYVFLTPFNLPPEKCMNMSLYTHIHAEKFEDSSKQLNKWGRSKDHFFKVILGENLVIYSFYFIDDVSCSRKITIAMMKEILILSFYRYKFLIKVVEDVKSVESDASIIWKCNQLWHIFCLIF